MITKDIILTSSFTIVYCCSLSNELVTAEPPRGKKAKQEAVVAEGGARGARAPHFIRTQHEKIFNPLEEFISFRMMPLSN